MSSVTRASVLAGLLALFALVVACTGTDVPAAPPASGTSASARVLSATSEATVAPPPQRSDPDAAHAMEHLRALAGDIGSRPATTGSERRAAEYIGEQLEAAGYKVTLEPFEVQATLRGSASLQLADGSTLDASPLNGSAEGSVQAPLAAAGLGRAEELEAALVRGRVAVLDRGELTFGEKVRNAQAAGAIAVVIVNNEPGVFRGDLGTVASIPAVSVAQEARAALVQAAGNGQAVDIEVETNEVHGTSQNVVGRPSDRPCTAYLGAHYDSVPAGPGANDNGSGTALLLELARSRRIDGVCVVAFGAEEVGLFGSEAFVREHDVDGAGRDGSRRRCTDGRRVRAGHVVRPRIFPGGRRAGAYVLQRRR